MHLGLKRVEQRKRRLKEAINELLRRCAGGRATAGRATAGRAAGAGRATDARRWPTNARRWPTNARRWPTGPTDARRTGRRSG